MHLETELAQFCLKNDKQKIEAQRGGLTLPINRGRYGSAASVKFRLVNFFFKMPYTCAKSDQNPIVTRQVFMNFKVQKSEFLVSFCLLFNQMLCIAHHKSPET